MEHFVTLFDSGFLLQGLALHSSLQDQGEPFTLWVVCMDDQVETVIEKLKYETLKPIPLRHLEEMFPQLLTVKPYRTRGEYCWTLTSFSYAAVMSIQNDVERVTYVDADVYFFGPASRLLCEMDASAADVLLTEHAYAPEYEQESTAGIYCVQFLPIRNSDSGQTIMKWWQARCIEWCYARHEDGKFGDQKYLDDWTKRWGISRVCVLKNKALTLAPWNVNHYGSDNSPLGIYHFHGLRIFEGLQIRLWLYYGIDLKFRKFIYNKYINVISACLMDLYSRNITVDLAPLSTGLIWNLKRFVKMTFLRNEMWVKL